MANCGRLSMAWNNQGIVVERQELFLNRCQDLRMGAAPQIGAPYTLREKRVAGKQNVAISREVECRTARSVARSVNHPHFDTIAGDSVAVLNEMFDGPALRHRQTDPLRLDIQFF